MSKEEKRYGYSMVAPAVIILTALIGYPIGYSIFVALSDKVVTQPAHFVGLRNFAKLLNDDVFRTTIFNSLIYTAVAVSCKAALGLLLAVILYHIRWGRKVFRGLVIIPWAVPLSMAGIAWMWMYEPMFSIINRTLMGLGIIKFGIPWLTHPFYARISVIITNIWRGLPFYSITFLAALMAVPTDLIDSAKMDGAGPLKRFFYITIPLASPLLVVVTLFSIMMTVAHFDIVWTLTKGGPLNQTHIFSTFSFVEGLMVGELGSGAAASLFIFPFLAAVSYFLLRQVRSRIA